MGAFRWRRRSTRYFCEVWVPYAEIRLRRSDGAYQPFAMQIDSGAVISLLRRSIADLLGVPLEGGQRVEMSAVVGGAVTAFRHDLEFRVGDGTLTFRAPFAIAEREDVPNLLGRLGIFDALQIEFDPRLKETRISAPRLEATT